MTSKRKMVFAKNFNTWCAMCKEYISCFKRISLVLSTRYYWEFSDLNIWWKMFLWYIVITCFFDMFIVFVHQYPVWKYNIFIPIYILFSIMIGLVSQIHQCLQIAELYMGRLHQEKWKYSFLFCPDNFFKNFYPQTLRIALNKNNKKVYAL